MLLIQRHVELTVDGKFGPQTEAAVKFFQARHRISPSGKAGARTWEALVVPLWKGKSGAAVSAVEIQLKYQYGFSSLSVDGKFGPMVKSAVKAFQKRYGLTPSGIVGERTWNALVVARHQVAAAARWRRLPGAATGRRSGGLHRSC